MALHDEAVSLIGNRTEPHRVLFDAPSSHSDDVRVPGGPLNLQTHGFSCSKGFWHYTSSSSQY